MTTQPTPEAPRQLSMPNVTRSEELLSFMAGLWPDWVDLTRRVERTSGLDRQLKNKHDSVYKRMDSYLDEYFANQVLLGLGEGGGDGA